jgi:peptide/nickel transport system permease protein
MKKYVGTRLLLFPPTLLLISLLAFYISVQAPGDPLDRFSRSIMETGENNTLSRDENQQSALRKQLGLDLPLFYFELTDFASPDTLYKIVSKPEKETLERLLAQGGNWEAISAYWKSLEKLNANLSSFRYDTLISANKSKKEFLNSLNEIQTTLQHLKASSSKRNIEFHFLVIESNFSFLKVPQTLTSDFSLLKHNHTAVFENKSTWKNYFPRLLFYGNNQYHRWLFGDGDQFSKGILRGDFGKSYASKEPVGTKIWSRIKVSLFFSVFSLFLAYLISIPLAARAALYPNSRFDLLSKNLLFALYSLPSFFVATLLLMTFANPDVLNFLPASGLKPATGFPANCGILEKIYLSLPYLILPLICYTYSSIALLSRTLRASLLENLSLDYIRTARAKGLSEQMVVYKHAYKNALLPLLALFASVFPYLLGGAVLVESIFTLPGMGLETVHAIHNHDYPVIVAIFTLSGFMTLVGSLLADILYALVDPRISFSKV